jgi:hypothetical protein
VRLDLTELHLARGEQKKAEILARELANEFTRADAPTHRARAFAYLREAVAARTESESLIELVKYVRSYVAIGDVDDEAPFAPPDA